MYIYYRVCLLCAAIGSKDLSQIKALADEVKSMIFCECLVVYFLLSMYTACRDDVR